MVGGPQGARVCAMAAERAALHADLLAAAQDQTQAATAAAKPGTAAGDAAKPGGDAKDSADDSSSSSSSGSGAGRAGAAAVLAGALRANPDDWGALLAYLDALLPEQARRADVAPGRPGWGASSLLWLSGGAAEAVQAAMQPAAQAGVAAAVGAEGWEARARAALDGARALVAELVDSVGPLARGAVKSGNSNGGGDPGNGSKQQLTMRGPHLAKVGCRGELGEHSGGL